MDFERDDEVLPDGSPAGDAGSIAQAGVCIDPDAFAQGALTLQGDVYHGHEGVVGSGVGEVSGGNLVTRWTKVLADGSDLQLQLYYDRAYLRLPIAASPLGPAGSFQDDLETYDLDFQPRLSAGASHALVWGLGYRRIQDDSVAAPALGFAPAEVTQDVFNGFLQDQISIGGQSILTLGTKIEHNDHTGVEFEPSIRLQRVLGHRNLLWAAVSRAVRVPSRIDRDLCRVGCPSGNMPGCSFIPRRVRDSVRVRARRRYNLAPTLALLTVARSGPRPGRTESR